MLTYTYLEQAIMWSFTDPEDLNYYMDILNRWNLVTPENERQRLLGILFETIRTHNEVEALYSPINIVGGGMLGTGSDVFNIVKDVGEGVKKTVETISKPYVAIPLLIIIAVGGIFIATKT